MNEQRLRLEDHIRRVQLFPIEFEDVNGSIEIDGFTLRYAQFSSRQDPNIVLVYRGEKHKIQYDVQLERRLGLYVANARKLQDRIAQLGIPQEQIMIQQGEQSILVSSYVGSVSKGVIDEIGKWFSVLNSTTYDKFSNLTNIILIPSQGNKLETGELVSGEFKYELDGMILYPPAFSKKEHRIPGVPHFISTLTHEYFHQYMSHAGATSLSQDWMKLGGWEFPFFYPKDTSLGQEICRYPNFVETNYGSISAAEEFCDAAVKSIYNRRSFKDQRKLDFLDQHFVNVGKGLIPDKVSIIRIEKRSIPQFPTKFTFAIMALQEIN